MTLDDTRAPDADIDARLREYAPRWRAAQPDPPRVDLLRLEAARPRLWLAPTLRVRAAVLAAAVAVAVVAALAGTVTVFRGGASGRTPGGDRSPTTRPTPTAPTSPGVVPWRALPPGESPMPQITIPASPDPGPALALPPCRATDLTVTTQKDGAGGNTFIVATITSAVACHLVGTPAVTPLDPAGRVLTVVPVEPRDLPPSFGSAVALGGRAEATVVFGWAHFWCRAPVTVARLRVALPENGGTVTVNGFGPSICSAGDQNDPPMPITVNTFSPPEFAPARVATAFRDVQVIVENPVQSGQTLRFVVVLTAPAGRDVPLDPCPDFSANVAVTNVESGLKSRLNCAEVPYRTAAGQPYLPGGTPVRFAMEVPIPTLTGPTEAKVLWHLEVADQVLGASQIELHP